MTRALQFKWLVAHYATEVSSDSARTTLTFAVQAFEASGAGRGMRDAGSRIDSLPRSPNFRRLLGRFPSVQRNISSHQLEPLGEANSHGREAVVRSSAGRATIGRAAGFAARASQSSSVESSILLIPSRSLDDSLRSREIPGHCDIPVEVSRCLNFALPVTRRQPDVHIRLIIRIIEHSPS